MARALWKGAIAFGLVNIPLIEHAEPQNAEVVDLMERLRQSLQGAGGAATKRPARANTPIACGRKQSHAA